MNNSKSASMLFAVLVSVGFMGWYRVHGLRLAIDAQSPNSQLLTDRVSDLSVHTFSQEGQLIKTLRTSELTRHGANHESILQRPTVRVFKDGSLSLHITANRGFLKKDNQHLVLSQQVIIRQTKQQGRLTTSLLNYFPKQQLATTKAKVHYTLPGVIINGKGMTAHLEEQTIELHQTSARYDKQA